MEKIVKTIEINIYDFEELNEDVKNEVIGNYIEDLLNITDYEKLNKNSNLYKAIKQAEDLHTPWFTIQYVWDYCNKKILKDLKKYKYLENGQFYK